MKGGNTASYLTRTPSIPLLVLILLNRSGSTGAFRLQGRRGITSVVRCSVGLPKGPSRTKNTTESEFRYGEEIRYRGSKTLRRGLVNEGFSRQKVMKTVRTVKKDGCRKSLWIWGAVVFLVRSFGYTKAKTRDTLWFLSLYFVFVDCCCGLRVPNMFHYQGECESLVAPYRAIL